MNEQNPIGGLPDCLDCGRPLSHLERIRGSRFCGESCRARHATLPSHETCDVCKRRLTPHQFGAGNCGSPECCRKLEEQARERNRIRTRDLNEEVGRIRDREALSRGIAEPELYSVVVVPSSRRACVPLPDERRSQFRAHLSSAVAEAVRSDSSDPTGSSETNDPPVQPRLASLLNQACSLCQGACCRNGRNHAYIRAETIRQYLSQHPETTPRDVANLYLGYVGEESMEDACIFLQPTGCALPREMRSKTCNRFLCAELVEFVQLDGGHESARGFIVATEGPRVIEAAFCDGDADPVSRFSLDEKLATDPRREDTIPLRPLESRIRLRKITS